MAERKTVTSKINGKSTFLDGYLTDSESESVFQGFLRGAKYIRKRCKCVICGKDLTLNDVNFLPTYETRMYCGDKRCLLKWLKTKGYDLE